MKKLHFLVCASALTLLSCQESLEERAEREAKEYTQQFCPTPTENYTRTDSVVFDKSTKTYTYYCAFSDVFDDQEIVNKNKKEIHDALKQNLSENTSLKAFKEAGFVFAYVVHSTKDKNKVLYKDSFKF